jgi:hypothetical protein
MASALLSGMHPSSGAAQVKLTEQIYIIYEEIQRTYFIASKMCGLKKKKNVGQFLKYRHSFRSQILTWVGALNSQRL